MTIPKVVREGAKAIVAGVVTAAVNLLVNLVNGTTAWPQTSAQWVTLIGTTLGSALLVWLQPAKVTDKQVEKDPTLIRVDAPEVNPVTGETPWVP
jgi:hypothetical protein